MDSRGSRCTKATSENVHRTFTHNSPKLEVTQMPINRRMNKQFLAHSYDGILHSNKKEQTTDSYNNIDKSHGQC
jgi:hypothetical protein